MNYNSDDYIKITLLLLGVIIITAGLHTVNATSVNENSTIYVNTAGNNSWNGAIPIYNGISGPKKTINNATGTVSNNGTIFIADGTYNESNINIDINMTIIGKSQIWTIINANRQGDIFNVKPGVTLTLENLTLENGYATNGGAINNQGKLIITDCILQNNTASNYGGAINNEGFNGQATATVNNNTFLNNKAQDGGAIINNGDYGKATAGINNNTFLNNSSIYVGGAVFNSGNFGHAIAIINNNTFLNNHANGYYGSGGAIDNAGDYGNATATISENTFLNNSSTYVGGAIEDTGFYGNVTAIVINNTFLNNNSTDGGAIINDGDHGTDITSTVTNNTFLNNRATNGGAVSDAGDYGNVRATVTNNKIVNNTAIDGGGINNSCDYGNVTATVTNNILLNNTATEGGAIINDGDHGNQLTVTINNNTLLNNSVTEYGGADYNTGDYGNTKVTITNCKMENNTAVEGGAIENDGNYGNTTAIITNCTIENNTATHYGGAIDIEGNYGKVIVNITNNILLNNTASDGGAINNAGDYGNTTATINGNTLLNNDAKNNGGAFYNTGGDGNASATLNYNRIVNNMGTDAYELNGQVNAVNNWWGTNFNDTNPESAGMTNFSVNTWIVLKITANPSTVDMRSNSTLIASLLYNNNYTKINGNLPDGIPVNFASTQGNVNPNKTTIQNNTAKTLFIPNTLENAHVSVNVDDQTVSTLLKVKNPTSTYTNVNTTDGYANHTVNLTALVTAADNSTVNEGNVTFKTGNAPSVTAPVINGKATYTWTVPSKWTAGNYNILTNYIGTTNYAASNNTTNLTVKPSAYLYLTYSTSNQIVGVPFNLTYKLSNNGPDPAYNVTVTITLPNGLTFIKATADTGNFTYNATNKKITWTLPTVPVGDPILLITAEALNTGTITITSNITASTFNQNPKPFTLHINIQSARNETSGNNTLVIVGNTIVKSYPGTVPMQNTGVPLTGLVLGLLGITGGMISSLRK